MPTTRQFAQSDAGLQLAAIDAAVTALQTALGDKATVAALDALATIVGAKADASALGSKADSSVVNALTARVNAIGALASVNGGGVVAGQYYDNSLHGSASGTLAGAAGRVDLAPLMLNADMTIDRIGVAVSTALAGSTARVVIYSANAAGWPDAKLYESGELSCAAAAMAEALLAPTFTFQKGTIYWVGVITSSTQTLRTVAVASAVNLGLTSATAANYATILRRTLTYANPLPANWTFANADRVANVTPPSIRFRAA